MQEVETSLTVTPENLDDMRASVAIMALSLSSMRVAILKDAEFLRLAASIIESEENVLRSLTKLAKIVGVDLDDVPVGAGMMMKAPAGD